MISEKNAVKDFYLKTNAFRKGIVPSFSVNIIIERRENLIWKPVLRLKIIKMPLAK
jgi:hypothetical protein